DYSILEKVLANVFPQIAGVPISYRWTGLVAITLDAMPHYHVPDQGLHVLAGYNGRGVAMATRMGAFLGHKLAGTPEAGDLPITPIRAIPFHRYKTTLLNIGMRWNRLMDLVGK